MQITNKLNLPDAFVEAVRNDAYSKGDADISVTTLVGPPQIRTLLEQYDAVIEEDASDRVWALLGQAVHTVLERSAREAVTEQRLYAELDGKRISGQIDSQDFRSGAIDDWKTTSAWAVKDGPRDDWVKQLNVYAWLAHENGIPTNALRVCAILRDWHWSEAQRYEHYPRGAVLTLPIPLWPIEQTRVYIRDRLRIHFAGETPDCTDQERWAKPGEWAVMKEGRKSAVRLLESYPEAAAYITSKGLKSPPHSIVERPGEYTRCMRYCPVRKFCPQLQREGIEPT